MAERIPVPGPEPPEELRQLAEAIADLHYVVGIIVENAKKLVPGESVDELNQAWAKSAGSIETLVHNLIPSTAPTAASTSQIPHQSLIKGQLTGDIGKTKRSLLGRLKDRFFTFWYSEPQTDEKRTKAADAACDYLEVGATVVSSIPGYEHVVELLSLTKQLIGVRAKRGV